MLWELMRIYFECGSQRKTPEGTDLSVCVWVGSNDIIIIHYYRLNTAGFTQECFYICTEGAAMAVMPLINLSTMSTIVLSQAMLKPLGT